MILPAAIEFETRTADLTGRQLRLSRYAYNPQAADALAHYLRDLTAHHLGVPRRLLDQVPVVWELVPAGKRESGIMEWRVRFDRPAVSWMHPRVSQM